MAWDAFRFGALVKNEACTQALLIAEGIKFVQEPENIRTLRVISANNFTASLLGQLHNLPVTYFTGAGQSAYNSRRTQHTERRWDAFHLLLMKLLVKLPAFPLLKLLAMPQDCQKPAVKSLVIAFAAISLAGCASTHAKNPSDPLESFNRSVYQFNDTLDKAITKPVAQGYNAIMPVPGKVMVSNFFSNLDDIIVTINNLLQFKFAQSASDGARFLFNSTFGMFGLFDVAHRLEKHNEDFGQTLGYWGTGSGPYIVLPILGPSTLRDGIGLYADSRPSKLRQVDHISSRNQLYLTKAINHRAQLLDQEKVLDEAALDRYEFIRDAYLLRRQSLVYDGSPPREEYEEEEEENGFEYQQVPIPNVPSSRLDGSPAATPASTAQHQQPAPAAPQIDAGRTNVHKVWIARHTGIR